LWDILFSYLRDPHSRPGAGRQITRRRKTQGKSQSRVKFFLYEAVRPQERLHRLYAGMLLDF
jgi:hypothetical protein